MARLTLMEPVAEVFRQEDVLERIFRHLVDPADVAQARVRYTVALGQIDTL